MRVSLRLKLTDFINTKIENEVMESIIKYHNLIPVPVKLKLWYEKSEFDHIDVMKFLETWQNKLEYKTSIRADHKQGMDDFTWFNVISKEDYDPKYKSQFWNIYSTPFGLINSINKFGELALFYTQPPQRPQKRNDND